MTDYEDEPVPYVLTKEEEAAAFRNAIEKKKEIVRWNYSKRPFDKDRLEAELKAIDWEKELNREEILKQANANKAHEIWQKENLKAIEDKKQKERKALEKEYNSKYFLWLMEENCKRLFHKNFDIDDDNSHLIHAVAMFLSRDQGIEKLFEFDRAMKKVPCNYSLERGLLIRGDSGLGKTFVFELVKDNKLNPVKIISMVEVVEEIKEEGLYRIILDKERIIYLDDVGTEEATVNHYGTKINWFKDFIEKHYPFKESFRNIVISTNLTGAEIEEKYGFRVRSRMREMFNVVDVKGKDRRK